MTTSGARWAAMLIAATWVGAMGAGCDVAGCPPGSVPFEGRCIAPEDALEMDAGDAGDPDSGFDDRDAEPDGGTDGGRDSGPPRDVGPDCMPTEEVCNDEDDDCDGHVDEDVQTAYYVDADGDGRGAPGTPVYACAAPMGYAASSDDCDDACATCFPGGTETCNGLDDDCDATADDGVATTFYRDADDDGYGLAGMTMAGCSLPDGYATISGDCNDADMSIRPGIAEMCDGTIDHNCNGVADPVDCTCTNGATQPCSGGTDVGPCNRGMQTCSGGTWGACVGRVDPGTETCNGADDDCDDSTDEGVQSTYYRDADGDGRGLAATTMRACSAPTGYVTSSDDCNDACATCYPGRAETCDSLNNDCDAATDEGVTTTYYVDADGDSYGLAAMPRAACSRPTGYAAASGDCNDGDMSIRPGAAEICDGVIDHDCDSMADLMDGCTCINGSSQACAGGTDTGPCARGTQTCASGAWGSCVGRVDPGTETCNASDDDCDGSTDEAVRTPYYRDADGDGRGVTGMTMQACSAPAGYVASSDDCNDACATCYPGRAEACDGLNNDCDATTDEGVLTTYYRDADGDGRGAAGVPMQACSAPAGYVASSDDCNDACATCYPGRAETCDGLSNDCDASIDEGVLTTYYRDVDADTYGISGTTMAACTMPAGYASRAGDCNDAAMSTNPGAVEICNGVDDNCTSGVDDASVVSTYGNSRHRTAVVRLSDGSYVAFYPLASGAAARRISSAGIPTGTETALPVSGQLVDIAAFAVGNQVLLAWGSSPRQTIEATVATVTSDSMSFSTTQTLATSIIAGRVRAFASGSNALVLWSGYTRGVSVARRSFPSLTGTGTTTTAADALTFFSASLSPAGTHAFVAYHDQDDGDLYVARVSMGTGTTADTTGPVPSEGDRFVALAAAAGAVTTSAGAVNRLAVATTTSAAERHAVHLFDIAADERLTYRRTIRYDDTAVDYAAVSPVESCDVAISGGRVFFGYLRADTGTNRTWRISTIADRTTYETLLTVDSSASRGYLGTSVTADGSGSVLTTASVVSSAGYVRLLGCR